MKREFIVDLIAAVCHVDDGLSRGTLTTLAVIEATISVFFCSGTVVLFWFGDAHFPFVHYFALSVLALCSVQYGLRTVSAVKKYVQSLHV